MHARLVGKPNLRFTFVPHPVSRVPSERCNEYLKGNDPVTGQPVVEELVEALIKPLSGDDSASRVIEKKVSRLIGPDTEANLQQYFIENKMTDYLPIILPTEEKVAEMLKGTSHKPYEPVGELRSGYEAGSFDVERVAANAVMAGAKPEHFPVILAMAASGIAAISTSTQSFSRFIIINGPIRKEINMNSGVGAMSPFNQANSVLARAATLLSINLGMGGVPNLTYWGSQGNISDWSHALCAENEENLPPGWKPFHVQKGFDAGESVVSFFHGYTTMHHKNTYESNKHESMLRLANMNLPSGVYKSGLCYLLDPTVAEDLVREGFPTKDSISQYIFENAKLTLKEFWNYHLVEGWSLPAAQKGVEPYASWLKLPPETVITRYRNVDEISMIVVGGRTNDFWQVGDWRHMGSFSIDEWR